MAQLVAEVYAQAIFDVAFELDKLEAVYSDYKEVKQSMIEHPELFAMIKSPKLEKVDKKEVLKAVFESAIEKELLNLFMILVDKRRVAELLAVFEAFEEKYRAHFKLERAIVRTVEPLNEEQIAQLATKLGQVTGLAVDIVNVIDPSVLGGMLIQIGDQVLDSSLKRKLSSLKDSLQQLAI